MTRSRPGSFRPSSSRNSARSPSSSWRSRLRSSRTPAPPRRLRSAARGLHLRPVGPWPSRSSSSTLATYSTGLIVIRCNSRSSDALRLRVQSQRAERLAGVEVLVQRFSTSRSRIASLSPALRVLLGSADARARPSRGRRACSSISMTSMSLSGSTGRPRGSMSSFVEAAHDVHDRVRLADVREELVAQALALRRARHEAGDVDELDRRREDLFAA